MSKKLKIVWFDIDYTDIRNEATIIGQGEQVSLENMKWALLNKHWGIDYEKDLKPVHAWGKYLCKINNLEYPGPGKLLPRKLADLILQTPGASRFMWFLA